MTKGDVIKTYLANFNLYMHLLSLEEQGYDHQKFKVYLPTKCHVNTKKARYNQNNEINPTKKYRWK